ncbi:predicted protein [Uncinocarpus reesii 1704]|uniref:Zn(2)-C6 fungal-type domain-containing protein n=1 Tax=Uncinocarpus reesii (strain UAMH 1704) TaxID=336963 RepID=C4JXY5_UNCRE|nr:uncharacterized protein UREG_07036 [Uncinocarpus reesii 1704]EEP82171.1 predicted protein [Uncinocarpus reesii 1704]
MSTSQDPPRKPAKASTAGGTKKPKATRSRNGCWTCRSRKKKCDETHPECNQCLSKGLKCEGYEARLKWGNGVASRGYLKGMNCPIMVMGPGESGGAAGGGNAARAKPAGSVKKATPADSDSEAGRGKGSVSSQNEAGDSAGTSPLSTAASSSLSPSLLSAFDQELFREFKEWGAQCLSMGSENGYSPFGEIMAHCEVSEALMANCLLFQLSLHPEHQEKLEAYYGKALRLFRQDVCDRARSLQDATLIAGLLLCSIGMQSCKSWTIHLNGLYTILQQRTAVQNRTPVAGELVASVGFLDIPSHIVGRQTPTLNIWRDYCRGKRGTEPASGMPYSLLDIFSLIAEPNVEWAFWSWTAGGLPTSRFSDALWEMNRLAGIIHARERRPRSRPGTLGARTQIPRPFSSPPTETLVGRILEQLEHVYDSPEATPSMTNLLLFPAFTVGTQHRFLTAQQRSFLEGFWAEYFADDGSAHLQLPLKILRALWAAKEETSAEEIAREWKVEVGLF